MLAPNGTPKGRVRIRADIANGGRFKRGRGERLEPDAPRFTRHASPLTTTVYTHPSDQEMATELRRLAC